MSLPSERRYHAERVLKRVETRHAIQAKREAARQSVTSKLPSQLVLGQTWEKLMSLVIIVNLVVMIMEVDRSAADDEPTNQLHWAEIFSWVILVIFGLELVLRLVIYRSHFWQDPWDVADLGFVLMDVIFSVIALAVGNLFPVSVLRIFRLAKLARVSKVVRLFPQIRVLLMGLVRSMSSIFWGSCLLFITVVLWAMIAVLLIHPLNKDLQYDTCGRCHRAYESVMASSLTFWKNLIAGDGWGETAIPVMERYPAAVMFFLPAFVTIALAVINLIVGVVVLAAQQASDDVKQEEFVETVLSKKEMQHHLLEQCKLMDLNHDGELSKDEIYAGYDNPSEFRSTLDRLDIHREDLEIVFALMDADKSGAISYKEMVHSLYTLTSSDQRFMLAYIKYYTTVIKDKIMDKLDQQQAKEVELEKQVLEEIHVIEGYEQEVATMVPQIEEDLDEIKRKEVVYMGPSLKEGLAKQEEGALPVSPSSTSKSEAPHRKSRREITAETVPLMKLSNEFNVLREELKGMFIDIDSKIAAVSGTPNDKRAISGLAVLPNRKSRRDNSYSCCPMEMPVEAHKVHTMPNDISLPKSGAMPSCISPLPRHSDPLTSKHEDLLT